jgi:5-methylcytosine-specific restriction endonuclease McrA
MSDDDIEYIKNTLRRGTVTWPGRAECLNRGRRKRVIGKTKKGEDKFLWERNCDGCNTWHLLKDNLLEVDHIVEIGPFNGDWNDFIKRMYCDQSNLQALCMVCHKRKTSNFNSTLRFERKAGKSLDDAIDSL